jgi:hypothetical protein
MSGILFLLTIAAFVVVVHWTYSNDRKPSAGATGVLAMTEGRIGEHASAAPRAAAWKRARPTRRDAPRNPAGTPRSSGSPPRWRQDPRRARRPR